ncbi:hypothetical protein BB560_006855 [Smittium megazygosporum]|uniref:Uncharacterized protein n=1 Tax=Smittium megazygosporum TaxID=133381 RepID=A0A2T9Y0S9_9FUNG|nr:hypothetical protein BB560_006855 [Smittium megazygosporum]
MCDLEIHPGLSKNCSGYGEFTLNGSMRVFFGYTLYFDTLIAGGDHNILIDSNVTEWRIRARVRCDQH